MSYQFFLLSIYLSISFLSIYLLINLFISIYLSLFLSIYLSFQGLRSLKSWRESQLSLEDVQQLRYTQPFLDKKIIQFHLPLRTVLIYLSVQYSYTSPYSTHIPLLTVLIYLSSYITRDTSPYRPHLYLTYSTHTSTYSTHIPLRTVLIHLSVQYSYTSPYSTHTPLSTVLIYLSLQYSYTSPPVLPIPTNPSRTKKSFLCLLLNNFSQISESYTFLQYKLGNQPFSSTDSILLIYNLIQ